MTFKNPIPHLPEDECCTKFKLCFSFDEPLTKEEAAESINEYFKENKLVGRSLFFNGEIMVRKYNGEVVPQK